MSNMVQLSSTYFYLMSEIDEVKQVELSKFYNRDISLENLNTYGTLEEFCETLNKLELNFYDVDVDYWALDERGLKHSVEYSFVEERWYVNKPFV